MLVGIAQELVLRRFRNLCPVHVSIRVLVGIAQELAGSTSYGWKRHVSIRVLVGIAQEPFSTAGLKLPNSGFNPCVSRNSSGAFFVLNYCNTYCKFQSVC